MVIHIIPYFVCLVKCRVLVLPLSVSDKKKVLHKKQTSGLSLKKLVVQELSKSEIHRLLKLNSVSYVTHFFNTLCHNRQVFNEQEECELTNYLIVAQ